MTDTETLDQIIFRVQAHYRMFYDYYDTPIDRETVASHILNMTKDAIILTGQINAIAGILKENAGILKEK